MNAPEVLCLAVITVLGLFLTVGSYILQRDRYWRRVWKELGEPQVESIEELKELMNKRTRPVPECKKEGQFQSYSSR